MWINNPEYKNYTEYPKNNEQIKNPYKPQSIPEKIKTQEKNEKQQEVIASEFKLYIQTSDPKEAFKSLKKIHTENKNSKLWDEIKDIYKKSSEEEKETFDSVIAIAKNEREKALTNLKNEEDLFYNSQWDQWDEEDFDELMSPLFNEINKLNYIISNLEKIKNAWTIKWELLSYKEKWDEYSDKILATISEWAKDISDIPERTYYQILNYLNKDDEEEGTLVNPEDNEDTESW